MVPDSASRIIQNGADRERFRERERERERRERLLGTIRHKAGSRSLRTSARPGLSYAKLSVLIIKVKSFYSKPLSRPRSAGRCCRAPSASLRHRAFIAAKTPPGPQCRQQGQLQWSVGLGSARKRGARNRGRRPERCASAASSWPASKAVRCTRCIFASR